MIKNGVDIPTQPLLCDHWLLIAFTVTNISDSPLSDFLLNLLRVKYGLEVGIVTEESLKVNLFFAFRHWSL